MGEIANQIFDEGLYTCSGTCEKCEKCERDGKHMMGI